MAKVESASDLRTWLNGKPPEFSKIISARAALRALPVIRWANEKWLREHALEFIRLAFVTWAECADRSLYPINETSSPDFAVTLAAKTGNKFASSSCYAVVNAAMAIDASDMTALTYAAADAADDAAEAVPGLWRSISADCDELLKIIEKQDAITSQIFRRLWFGKPTRRWMKELPAFHSKLHKIDKNYDVWLDWYKRRIRGEVASFDIPGDNNRINDKAILRRLAEATDEGFWSKGHEHVNATLKSWLDEARARVATTLFEPMPQVEELLPDPPIIPPQNRNAISFYQDENGRIAIDTRSSVEHMRVDTDARDRHSEAVSEAKAVLQRCQRNNAAARLTLRLENYLDALGSSIEDTKPSLLVQRGEKLRQELLAYDAPDTLLDPIADDILVDLKGWQSSHNMLVGLDPVLMGIDTAMLGPDRRPALIPPDEIRQLAQDAQKADLLADGILEILIEAADLAPAVPDPTDRRTNASIETVRNLFIEAVSIALHYPIKSLVSAVVVSGIVSPILVGGVGAPISILSSIKAAEYLVVHRQWIEGKMGNTPRWQALFMRVADWLERAGPFKQK